MQKNITKYFAAITGRDYIKTKDGKRIPFWDMLDHQPGGWLTSIARIKSGIPNHNERIFDCGAWTYKDEDIPQLKGKIVDSSYAYNRYIIHANDGDLLIASDHMLLPGKDNEKRIKINLKNAEEFIDICDKKYVPTACVHGRDIDEKIKNLKEMKRLGYKSFALGGLAAMSKKRGYCISVVKAAMENADSTDRVHVLGLSSFLYAKEWIKMGVTSFDGSSHYLKAMTAGCFYNPDGSWLIASKPDEETSIPRCECLACETARENGGDTRKYGNSAGNICRAAHNLNIAIKIFKDYSTNDIE